MAGNLLAVKQDDGDVIPMLGEQFCVLRNVHFGEFHTAAFEDVFGAVAEMAAGFGVDGDFTHNNN